MDIFRVRSFVNGELTPLVDFDTTRVQLKNGEVIIGSFDMQGLDNSWMSEIKTKVLDNNKNNWWFLERENKKPVLIKGTDIQDISIYYLGNIIATWTEDGMAAYASSQSN